MSEIIQKRLGPISQLRVIWNFNRLDRHAHAANSIGKAEDTKKNELLSQSPDLITAVWKLIWKIIGTAFRLQ